MLGTTWLWSIPQVNACPRPSPGLWKWSSAAPYSCDASTTVSPLGGTSVLSGLGSVFAVRVAGAQAYPVCLPLELDSHPSRHNVLEQGVG